MILARKIFSFLLVVLVLGYAGGINIAKHLCEGKVVAKALNSEVKVCKKAKESKTPSTNYPSISEQSCCDTEFSFFQSDDFSENQVSLDFTLDSFFIHDAFTVPVLITVNQPLYNYFPPPLYSKPLHVVYEQYLI